jgi:hypothetical protein
MADDDLPQDRGYAIADEGSFNVTQFQPQGPVGAAFLADDQYIIRGLMGPWGSGKTNLAFMDMFKWAAGAPVCTDGVRRFGACVVRDTYRNLETTIKTWHAWQTKQDGHWTGGSGDRPATHELRFRLLDDTILNIRVDFRAIGDLTLEEALLGAEFNWFFANELTTLPVDIMTYAPGRLGRYPSAKLLGSDPAKIAARPQRMVVDFNAPEVGTPVYKYFEEECPPTTKLYRQPGGRSPHAENKSNLPPGYYENLIAANAHRPWFIRRFVDNEFGFSRLGSPVFADEYQDEMHCPGIIPVADLPIYLGLDGGMGLHPAMVVLQWHPSGIIKIPLSLYAGRCGGARFAEMAKVFLAQNCKGLPIAGCWIDPSAYRGIDTESSEISFVQQIGEALKVAVPPCWTNEISPRLDVWRKTLSRQMGGQPMLQISAACKLMRRGMNSEYFYPKKKDGELHADPRPDKNAECSHEIDAGGYGLCGMLGPEFVLRDSMPVVRYVRHGERATARASGNRQMRTDFNL